MGLPPEIEHSIKLDANHSDICRFDMSVKVDRDNYDLVSRSITEIYNESIDRAGELRIFVLL